MQLQLATRKYNVQYTLPDNIGNCTQDDTALSFRSNHIPPKRLNPNFEKKLFYYILFYVLNYEHEYEPSLECLVNKLQWLHHSYGTDFCCITWRQILNTFWRRHKNTHIRLRDAGKGRCKCDGCSVLLWWGRLSTWLSPLAGRLDTAERVTRVSIYARPVMIYQHTSNHTIRLTRHGRHWWYNTQWVSEQMLKGTSAQLGYTVPFTLIHAGKYRTEDKLKIQTIQKLNTIQKKNKQCKTTNQNYPGSVTFLQHLARKRVDLILQHSWAHTGKY